MKANETPMKVQHLENVGHQRKAKFPIPNQHCLQDFWGTKTARQEGISSGLNGSGVALGVRIQDHSEPVTYYLKKSLAADPDYLPALIQLIDLLRKNGQEKQWRALAEQAARRFPDESAILLRAIELAAAGKAYKKAAGFAHKLLALDPINRHARQRMIDLQIAHARKQMRANRLTSRGGRRRISSFTSSHRTFGFSQETIFVFLVVPPKQNRQDGHDC